MQGTFNVFHTEWLSTSTVIVVFGTVKKESER